MSERNYGALIAWAIEARDKIWRYIKPWPRWWELMFVACISIFVTSTIFFSLDLLGEFLQIFNINYPS